MLSNYSHTNGVAAADSRQVKSKPGILYAASGYNNHSVGGLGVTGIDLYIQLHDAIAVPANGTVPKLETQAFGLLPWTLPVPTGGVECTTGILLVASTTPLTLTAAAVAKTTFNAQYA